MGSAVCMAVESVTMVRSENRWWCEVDDGVSVSN